MKPEIVPIRGLPGSGKTAMAKKLRTLDINRRPIRIVHRHGEHLTINF